MIKNLFFLYVITFCLIINTKKIPLYVIFTPSHADLFNEWFLPSLPQNEFDLKITRIDQTCASATFKKTGWKDTTLQKVQMIIDAVQETWGSFFVYSDVDIQFFGSIEDDLVKLFAGYDLVIQKDDPSGKVCSGFFVCRSNEKTLALWQDVLSAMQEFEKYSDQGALNYCLRKKNNPHEVQWNYLPETYFGGGTHAGKKWHAGEQMYVPVGAKMHHANWTAGLYNKQMQLAYVKERVLWLRKKKFKLHW